MNDMYITVTGLNHYYGKTPFKIGTIVKISKEPDNDYDAEAIKVTLPQINTIGYVANSAHTVQGGTMSAGRLYDKIGDFAFAMVMFITHSSVICRVVDPADVEEVTVIKSYSYSDNRAEIL